MYNIIEKLKPITPSITITSLTENLFSDSSRATEAKKQYGCIIIDPSLPLFERLCIYLRKSDFFFLCDFPIILALRLVSKKFCYTASTINNTTTQESPLNVKAIIPFNHSDLYPNTGSWIQKNSILRSKVI